MRIIDDQGNVTSKQVCRATRDVCDKVDDLFDDLFKKGMTPIEARVVLAYIQGNIDVTGIIQIMKRQYK